MTLVLLALSRPLTVVIALIAVALSSVLALERMPVDIFPQVGDPVIYVSQPYGGMDPQQMEGYLTYYYEYHFLYITGIDHVESRSIPGQALLKLVFHQGTDMASAMGETMGYVTRARASIPAGPVPPYITRFDTGSVAIAQLIFSSPSRTQAELQDIALNRVRPLFATLEGVSAPPPFGGAQRTIVITLNPDKLQQYRISPEEAIAAINRGTVIQPAGDLRTGKLDRIARTNATLGGNLAELLDTPIRPVSGTTVFLRDIGTIENGTDILTAYAHVNGKRTVYIPVTKRPDASTLAVINRVKAAIPDFKKAAPEDVDIRLEFDQSPFVANSIRGLVTEGLLGALLTGLMVLLFLRDWRSALIVVMNIPFALLTAVIFLWAAGQSINIMTLGGLALAVGVLVDEATVEIENIHTQMLPGVSRARAVVEACSRTAIARLLSMFCILAVFVPSFFMIGVGRQLFIPLSLAVGFSMMASYLLSSTLVPVFSTWLMREAHRGEASFLHGIYERYLREALRERIREALRRDLPGTQVSFEAADIVSQVMSFGSPTPIEVAVQGISLADDYAHAQKIRAELSKLSFLRDLELAQEGSFPTLDITVDRERAGQLGLTMSDVVHSVVPATSSSRYTDPNYWRDPVSGNAFQIQVQLPQNRMQGLEEVGGVPLMRDGHSQTQLSDIAEMKLGTMPGLIERYNGQHVVSLTANIHGVTLGQSAPLLQRAIQAAGAPPRGLTVRLRGEIPPLEQTLAGLRLGLLLAVLAIFLLLAANFQSLRLALAILLTIPAVLCGVLIMLRLTGTTLNVQSFMGAIMAIGIAVANSILLVTFAERARHEGQAIADATREGAGSRLRAVLMTATAMIFGMLPMAIGAGESGAQAAPLGRAVIGGLLLATFATLGVLPAIYAILQSRAAVRSVSLNPMDPESRYYEHP